MDLPQSNSKTREESWILTFFSLRELEKPSIRNNSDVVAAGFAHFAYPSILINSEESVFIFQMIITSMYCLFE